MADFCQSDPEKIGDRPLRERVQYLKRTRQGRLEMCSASEIIYNEGVRDNLLANVRSLMESVGWSAQKALENLKVPETEWPKYLAML